MSRRRGVSANAYKCVIHDGITAEAAAKIVAVDRDRSV
jgi:hypothetical protein